jgi:hypothetical protein
VIEIEENRAMKGMESPVIQRRMDRQNSALA